MTSIDLSQSRVVGCNIPVSAEASTGICYNRPPSTEINRSRSNAGNRFYYTRQPPLLRTEAVRWSKFFYLLLMRFLQVPLCRYRFKVIFVNIIFLLSGNIIEYICFWCFNSIIMTWNKRLGFTKSVIMGLNNISPWPCPLSVICLPCVIIWLYSTP